MHETAEEARKETERMLNVYADFCENMLAMPVTCGCKTEKEKFNGAEATYAIECMMHDKKALQAGTSHYFGDGFARVFDIQFTDRNNQKAYPHQTSWGVSTRLIGGIIMTHGDNSGLVLPPKIAPIQIIIVPVAQHKPGVLDAADALCQTLAAQGYRVKVDASENSLGWKCAEYEMKGVPLRIELGPRDIEAGNCVMACRTGGEKTAVTLSDAARAAGEQLQKVQEALFSKAAKNLAEHTFPAASMQEARALQEQKGGFIKTMWCGEEACELRMKEETGMSSRCIPFKQERLSDVCPICGKPEKCMVYWGIAY